MTDDIPGVHEQCAWVTGKLEINLESDIPWRSQQFHDLAYPWFQHLDELEAYKHIHLATTDAWMKEGPRRRDQSLIHKCKHDPSGSLLDMIQAYCLRLARAAQLSGDRKYVDELIHQFRIYEMSLCDSKSGCYHQGKGWLEDDATSPGAWSRGQGWLLHGMAHCLPLLEAWPDEQQELLDYALALLNTLLPLQGKSGLWHQLIDRPEESCPDSSGSALILEACILVSVFIQDYTSFEHKIIQAGLGI